MTKVFIGIGSNSEPARQLRLAVQALADRYGKLSISTVYVSAPVGIDGPDFLNLVVGVDTADPPLLVAQTLKEIECRQNRLAGSGHSRAIDLDFLLYGSRVIDTPELTLPREDIRQHAFVLRPLAELAPTLRHPVTGQCLAAMWAAFPAQSQPLRIVELELS